MFQSKWWVAAIVLGLTVMALPVQAQNAPSPDPAMAPPAQQPGMLVRSDKVIGLRVVNSSNQDLGKVEDIVLSPDGHSVSYVVLAYGGIFSHKYFAVPWTAFQFQERNGKLEHAVLNVSKETLDKAQGFDKKHWPERANMDLFKTTGQEPAAGREATGNLSFDYRKVSKLQGMDLKNDREKTGNLKELMIDHRGMVTFGIISVSSGKVSPVPWSAIQIRPDQKNLYLNVDKQRLESITYDKDDLSKLNNHDEMMRIYQTYNVQPIAAHEGQRRFREVQAGTWEAWAADSSYSKLYNAEKVTTIRGTVEKVSTFMPAEGAVPGLRLEIKTEKGETMLVNAGPMPYARSQKIEFKNGDKVEVTGAQADFQNEKVILASEIKDHQTLRLRDRDGHPLWKVDELQKLEPTEEH